MCGLLTCAMPMNVIVSAFVSDDDL